MHLDIEDLLVSAIGSLMGRFLLLILAIWIGSGIGTIGCYGSDIIQAKSSYIMDIPWMVLFGPFRLFNMWAVLNLPFLIVALFYFMMKEDAGILEWGIIVGVESLAVMAGWAHHINYGWVDMSLAWLCWVLLLGSFETGLWFLKHRAHNRWMREISELNAQNRYCIAKQEAIERLRIERERQHDR